MRAPASGITLDEHDAAIVKGMLERGDRQHDIAAWFGVNGGRIGEIASGRKFEGVAAVHHGLPPQGPYSSGRSSSEARKKLAEIRGKLVNIIEEIDEQIMALDETPEQLDD